MRHSSANPKPLPDQATLTRMFTYEDGRLIWKDAGQPHYNSKSAGTAIRGYIYVNIDYKLYMRSRLIYKMLTGQDPDNIRHLDGDRQNDRLSNLKSVTQAENNRDNVNQAAKTSGIKGIIWNKSRCLWQIAVFPNKKRMQIGQRAELSEAIKVLEEYNEVN